jgi:septal ring factor EnvC (AmiA/AmiB activator)
VGVHVGSEVSGCWKRVVSGLPRQWQMGIALVIVLAPASLMAQEKKTQADDLQKIEYSEETLEETQSLLGKIEASIKALQQESKQLDQKAVEKRREIKRVEGSLGQKLRLSRLYDYKLYNTEQEEEQLGKELERLDREIATHKLQLERELNQLELLGPQGAPHYLVARGSSGVDEYFVRKAGAQQALETLRQQLMERAMVREVLKEMESSHEQTQVVSQQTREERQSTEKQLKGKLDDLESLMQTKKKARDQMAVLDERQQRVAQIIRLLMRQKTAREGAEAASRLLVSEEGKLPWPCTTPLVRGFSKDTTNEAAYNPGVDLALPRGSEVRTVASGEVLYAGTFKGYDKMVIVDHGGGMCSLYAFLDKILVAQGEAVEKDAVVGLSGLLEGNWGPGVHFELRKDGEAIDPRVWFKAASGSADADRSGE